jgi:hypothetical protein
VTHQRAVGSSKEPQSRSARSRLRRLDSTGLDERDSATARSALARVTAGVKRKPARKKDHAKYDFAGQLLRRAEPAIRWSLLTCDLPPRAVALERVSASRRKKLVAALERRTTWPCRSRKIRV